MIQKEIIVKKDAEIKYLKAEIELLKKLELHERKVRKNRLVTVQAFNYRRYKKGSCSIKMTLENEFNIIYNIKRIQRIVRKFNIICPIRKANSYKRIAKTTKEHSIVPNLLNRNFKQGVPGKVLLTAITYLPYGNNQMAYLSTIKDASTNEILAYNLSNRITLDIATDTIHKLIKKSKFKL